MRVAVITYHYAHNFGAMLQAYALQHHIISLGHECQIIDFRRIDETKNYTIFKPSNDVKTLVKNVIRLVHYRSLRLGCNRFERFMSDDCILTSRYTRLEELQTNPPQADLYITGSDQVWNVSRYVRPEFFLQFGPPSVKRISYAASIGTSEIPTQSKSIVKSYLQSFDAISVREQQARQLLSDLDIDSQVVLDPVFLIPRETWKKLAVSPKRNKPYIFCYNLNNPPALNLALQTLKNQTGLDIVLISNDLFPRVIHDEFVRNAGPREFLGYLNDAQLVVTSSFHGTALSIVLEKDFYSVVNNVGSSRIDNILNITQLKDRDVTYNPETCDARATINYQCVNELLQTAIITSKSFLLDHLSER